MSTTLEARISQLRDASDRLGNAAANIRAAVETSHGIVQALVARGVVSAAADQFFGLYRQRSSVMNEWPDDLNDFARLLELAAQAIEDAQRDTDGTDSGADTDTSDDSGGSGTGHGHGSDSGSGTGTGGGTGGAGTGTDTYPGGTGGAGGEGSTGGVFPGGGSYPGGSGGTGGTGGSYPGGSGGTGGHGGSGGTGGSGHSSSSGHSQEQELPEDEAGAEDDGMPPETYVNTANEQLIAQTEGAQAEIETRRARIADLEQDRTALQVQIDQMLQATGGQPTPRIRGMQQQLADIDALIGGEQTSIDQLTQHIEQLQQRLALVTPPPGADLDLIRSLEGSRTSEAILRATHQADNSINCVNWVCTRAPIPPGIPTNAAEWVQNAINHPEYGIQIGDKPLTGSVIVMQPEHPFADDRYGHVMYVERVDPDGTVWVTDNFNHEPVQFSRLTDEMTGPNIQYLYLPWQTVG